MFLPGGEGVCGGLGGVGGGSQEVQDEKVVQKVREEYEVHEAQGSFVLWGGKRCNKCWLEEENNVHELHNSQEK